MRAPDRTYSDELTIELGGKTVTMTHALPSHSNDSSIIRFNDERTIFVVDFVNVRRVPFQNLGGGPVAPWIAAHRPAVVLDDDVDHSTGYLEDLLAAVTQGIEEGRSLEELQETVLMEDYSDYAQYEAWRAMNVAGAYEGLMSNQ